MVIQYLLKTPPNIERYSLALYYYIEQPNQEYYERRAVVWHDFKHVDIELPHLDRETIDGVRYYKIPDEEELIKLVSITSITSHYNKQIFIDWRKRVGTETADKITKAS